MMWGVLSAGVGVAPLLRNPPAVWRDVNRFRRGLIFKAYRLVYHSTIGLRIIKKKKKIWGVLSAGVGVAPLLRNLRTHLPEGSCKATWKRELKLPWREAGPPNHHDDKVDSDQ